MVFAGVLFDKLGGYTGPRTIPICFALGSSGIAAAFGSLCTENIYVFSSLISVELFTGGFVMPALTGAMLNTVPTSSRALANAVANLSYNLLGQLTSPPIYGFFFDLWGGRWGMVSLQCGGIVTVLASCVALISSKSYLNLIL